MKTALLTTLLVLGAVAPTTLASADVVDEAWAIVAPVTNCVGIGPDGQEDRIGNAWIFTDVLYQRPGNACA